MEIATLISEQNKPKNFQARSFASDTTGKGNMVDFSDPKLELGMWLMAVRGYFKPQNQAVPEGDYSGAYAHNWKNEIKIMHRCLLRASQLSLRLIHSTDEQKSLFSTADEFPNFSSLLEQSDEEAKDIDYESARALLVLSEALNDLVLVCEIALESRFVGFQTWTSLGNILRRELERSPVAKKLIRYARHVSAGKLPPMFHTVVREKVQNTIVGTEVVLVFEQISRLLEWLGFIEQTLEKDRPLKQTLPIFSLVNEEAQTLIDLIDNRAIKLEGISQDLFDTLDGTSYAVKMELKKVFARELVGVSELKHSPTIYGKLENAHGLLQNAFQQSAVGLAQAFDRNLDGGRLFDNFQTRLEQSLLLRKELWIVMQVVRKAESEGEDFSTAKLHDGLVSFRNGSMRYLMFKDWEASERFIDEVISARGVSELTPVLHRFGAYLETLHGQICMRAVLAEHLFDYPDLEN